jgi:hypothetical protein
LFGHYIHRGLTRHGYKDVSATRLCLDWTPDFDKIILDFPDYLGISLIIGGKDISLPLVIV